MYQLQMIFMETKLNGGNIFRKILYKSKDNTIMKVKTYFK